MKVKAFTLIECLIAMFILGIASLLLCQGYTTLMRLTNKTSRVNASIGQQMADAEAGLADTHSVQVGGSTYKPAMKIKMMTAGGAAPESRSYDAKAEYSTNLTVWEVKAYNYKGKGRFDDESKDGTEMRYVYFHK